MSSREYDTMLHRSRARATSFGAAALDYDRRRPGYPQSLIDELLTRAPRRVLDVGTGTGLAARQIVDRVPELVGVEPDPRMAEVAAGHGLTVECARFEDWDAGDRRFDLILSAQAWHWVDPATGPARAVQLLDESGLLAVFWNFARPSPELRAAVEPVYRRHAPELLNRTLLLGNDDGRADRAAASFDARPELEASKITHHPSAIAYTPRQWVDHVATWSDHRRVIGQRGSGLLAGLLGALAERETLTMDYLNTVVSARRAAA